MSNLAVLAEGAFAMLRPELEKLPGAPRSAAEFIDRLTAAPAEPMAAPLANAGKLLTIPQAAARLGVCNRSVQNWAREGKLARVKIGKTVRIPESAILAALESPRGA